MIEREQGGGSVARSAAQPCTGWNCFPENDAQVGFEAGLIAEELHRADDEVAFVTGDRRIGARKSESATGAQLNFEMIKQADRDDQRLDLVKSVRPPLLDGQRKIDL